MPELAFQKEPDRDLTVFPEGKLPEDAVTQRDLINYLIRMHREQLQSISPTNEASLANYKRIIQPAWMRTMQLKWPPDSVRAMVKSSVKKAGYTAEELEMPRPGQNETIPLVHFAPLRSGSARNLTVVVLAHEEGKAHFVDNAGNPAGLAWQFLDQGFDVTFAAAASGAANPDQTSILFTCYNRTRVQEQVRDLVAICEGIRQLHFNRCRVVLVGSSRAGIWSLLAAPAADAVIADCRLVDVADDQTLLTPDLFCPGIRNIDTFSGAPIMAAPHPLVLFNVAQGFPTSSLRASYKVLSAEKNFRVVSGPLNDHEIVASVLALGN